MIYAFCSFVNAHNNNDAYPGITSGDRTLMIFLTRGLKDLEQDSSSMEKRMSYKFLKRLLSYVDSAQEFIAHLGE